jgi:Glycoside-hydrolase family GH114
MNAQTPPHGMIPSRTVWRRALVGLAVIATMTLGTAAIMYASIEPDVEFSGDPESATRQATLAKVAQWSFGEAVETGTGRMAASARMVVIDPAPLAALTIPQSIAHVETVQRADATGRRLVLATAALAATSKVSLPPLDDLAMRGFDGVFLDVSDLMRASPSASARSDVATAIVRLAGGARLVNPTFLIVLRNAAELTVDTRVAKTIDGAAADHLLYGQEGGTSANSPTEVATMMHDLDRVKRAGQVVFVAEYLDALAPSVRVAVRGRLQKMGYVAYIGQKSTARFSMPGRS